MAKNIFVKTEEPTETEAQSTPEPLDKKQQKAPEKTAKKEVNFLKGMFDGTILTKKFVLENLSVVMIIVVGGILFTTNRYYMEHTVKQTKKLKEENERLEIIRIEKKMNLMQATQLMNIASYLDSMGVKESTELPKKLILLEE